MVGIRVASVIMCHLETCETINNSWGFNINDKSYKSVKTIIQYLVKAAGHNANFLLNVGPQADGNIQQEFIDTLKKVGEWLQQNGESIYGTRGNVIAAQELGNRYCERKKIICSYSSITNGKFYPAAYDHTESIFCCNYFQINNL